MRCLSSALVAHRTPAGKAHTVPAGRGHAVVCAVACRAGLRVVNAPPHRGQVSPDVLTRNVMSEHATEPSWVRFVGVVTALALCAGAQWYIFHGEHWSEASTVEVLGAIAARRRRRSRQRT